MIRTHARELRIGVVVVASCRTISALLNEAFVVAVVSGVVGAAASGAAVEGAEERTEGGDAGGEDGEGELETMGLGFSTGDDKGEVEKGDYAHTRPRR